MTITIEYALRFDSEVSIMTGRPTPQKENTVRTFSTFALIIIFPKAQRNPSPDPIFEVLEPFIVLH
jgi:hypothetical protein